MDLVLTDPQIVMQHASILIDAFQRHLNEEPENFLLRLKAYIAFGAPFQETFNQYVINHWIVLRNNQKQQIGYFEPS
jgi:hypothetical protein